MIRLAIITTHPIQYNAPLFKLLAKRGRIKIKVFYTWGKASLNKFDPGFNKNIEWDIPLLEGYEYSLVNNTASKPGSHHFYGINNPGLINDIEEWDAEAILVYGWAFKSHLKAIRHFHKKIPVFFRGDSTLLGKKNPFKQFLRTIFLKWVYGNVDKALYVGTNNKKYFFKYGLKSNQLVFVPHAIDNNRFSYNEDKYASAGADWRKELNIQIDDIVFLFAAKLDSNKNAAILVDAFINIENINVHLVIAGNGEQEVGLHKNYEGIKNLHFLPFQNQSKMPVLYRVGDVFVLPSGSETWGLSINEAMACSRAILASDTCGAAVDLVHNGINGYLFESGNKTDLINKMKKFVLSKNEIKKMGAASYDLIKDWNYENGAKALEAIMGIKY